MKILSLGAGVQSSVVLLMSQIGDLPRVDHAVFSDTGWEPAAVYRNLEWLKTMTDIPIHVVKKGNIRQDTLDAQDGKIKRAASLPYFIKNPDGSQGAIMRQCTKEYKIEVIWKKTRELLGLKPRQRVPKDVSVEMWFGISSDETQRMRDPANAWTVNKYPLIEDVWMGRSACLGWMEYHGYPEPPRSACVGCPFHNDVEWQRMKDEDPEDFEDACQFDELIRHRERIDGEQYLHRSLKPLREVHFKYADQLSLFGNDCSGMCGV